MLAVERSAPRLTSHHNGKWPVKGHRAGKLREFYRSHMESCEKKKRSESFDRVSMSQYESESTLEYKYQNLESPRSAEFMFQRGCRPKPTRPLTADEGVTMDAF